MSEKGPWLTEGKSENLEERQEKVQEGEARSSRVQRMRDTLDKARDQMKKENRDPWRTEEGIIMPETQAPKNHQEAEGLARLRKHSGAGYRDEEYKEAKRELSKGKSPNAAESADRALLEQQIKEGREDYRKAKEEQSNATEAVSAARIEGNLGGELLSPSPTEGYPEVRKELEADDYDTQTEAYCQAELSEVPEFMEDKKKAKEQLEDGRYETATEAFYAARLKAGAKDVEGEREKHEKVLNDWEELLDKGRMTTTEKELIPREKTSEGKEESFLSSLTESILGERK